MGVARGRPRVNSIVAPLLELTAQGKGRLYSAGLDGNQTRTHQPGRLLAVGPPRSGGPIVRAHPAGISLKNSNLPNRTLMRGTTGAALRLNTACRQGLLAATATATILVSAVVAVSVLAIAVITVAIAIVTATILVTAITTAGSLVGRATASGRCGIYGCVNGGKTGRPSCRRRACLAS